MEMKICITIEIENEQPINKEVKPKIEIIRKNKASKTPVLDDHDYNDQFIPLSAFYPPLKGNKNGYYGNKNAAKTYRKGRHTHRCKTCGAVKRRRLNGKRYCVECKPTDWQGE